MALLKPPNECHHCYTIYSTAILSYIQYGGRAMCKFLQGEYKKYIQYAVFFSTLLLTNCHALNLVFVSTMYHQGMRVGNSKLHFQTTSSFCSNRNFMIFFRECTRIKCYCSSATHCKYLLSAYIASLRINFHVVQIIAWELICLTLKLFTKNPVHMSLFIAQELTFFKYLFHK